MAFEFFAIVRNDGAHTSLSKLTLNDELREEMLHAFTIPAGKWLEPEVMKAPFDESYHLADKELFEINQYNLPPDILNAIRFPAEYSEFDGGKKGIADLKAIFAADLQEDSLTAIFKTISSTKKLEPSKNLMLVCSDKEYDKQPAPGIIFDKKITAVYKDGTLLFRSTGTVNHILSLKAHIKEANDLEVVAFLEARFETDPEKILGIADTWIRKRFASLMESNLFEERSALEIYETAQSFSTDLPIELSKDRQKLVLPEEKKEIRMILKFLNEEYYKGALTGKDYQTSSKRPLEKPENAFAGKSKKAALSF